MRAWQSELDLYPTPGSEMSYCRECNGFRYWAATEDPDTAECRGCGRRVSRKSRNSGGFRMDRPVLNVLVACEYSGIVRDAFLRAGHRALSVDLLPSESTLGLTETQYPPRHLQGDVTRLLQSCPWSEDGTWDLVIAHPPCTRLTNAGVRWLHERNLWNELDEASEFFRKCLNANARHIAVENPIMHRHARERIGVDPDQYIQPWQFGHNESKRTGLWLKNLPALEPEVTVKPDNVEQRVWRMGPCPERAKLRSRFFEGIADAMVRQWVPFILSTRSV